jgi:uncharacterized protein DUF1629
MNYLIVATTRPAGTCWLGSVENVAHDEKFITGEPLAPGFPDDAQFSMDDGFPKDIRLADALRNSDSLLVVSERFKSALEAAPGALTQNEVLPVKIVNHRGRTEKAPYFIVNQLNYPFCLDENKSKGVRSTLTPLEFQFIDKMVLDESLVPPDLMLFRPAQYPRVALIRRDLAQALSPIGLKGVNFTEIADYDF